MQALIGKVAIITGASSGIGRAAALLFAAEGAKIVAGARRGAELDALATQIGATGGQIVVVAGDVRDEAFAVAMVHAARERFGGLDVAFNNAGAVGEMAAAPDLSPEGWRDTLETNLTGAFLNAKHQLPAMLERGSGSLIFTSSFVGHSLGMPGMTAYAASKAGLVGLVRSLAAEFGPQGIRVNALLPGGTDTPSGPAATGTPESLAFVEGLHALKRIARPEEIAQAAMYLASDASSFVTGTAMLVDGGVSITRT